jgi:hypothetical protein
VDYPREELGIFLILASIPSLRTALCAFPRYPTLLKANAARGDDQVLAAIAVVAGRLEVSESIHRRFAAEGFWRTYFDRVKTSQSAEVQENCMTLVNIFCAVGWTDEFADYIRHLAMLLSSPDLATKAIQQIYTLSFLRESARVFTEMGMVSYFENLRGSPYWAKCAEQVLANVKQASEKK